MLYDALRSINDCWGYMCGMKYIGDASTRPMVQLGLPGKHLRHLQHSYWDSDLNAARTSSFVFVSISPKIFSASVSLRVVSASVAMASLSAVAPFSR